MISAASQSPAGRAEPPASDSPFPGWEAFLPQLVHPVKVAVVEALLYIGEPLSSAQLTKFFSEEGGLFGESNVRYHLRALATVGVLEVVPPGALSDGSHRAKFFYFPAMSPSGAILGHDHIDG